MSITQSRQLASLSDDADGSDLCEPRTADVEPRTVQVTLAIERRAAYEDLHQGARREEQRAALGVVGVEGFPLASVHLKPVWAAWPAPRALGDRPLVVRGGLAKSILGAAVLNVQILLVALTGLSVHRRDRDHLKPLAPVQLAPLQRVLRVLRVLRAAGLKPEVRLAV